MKCDKDELCYNKPEWRVTYVSEPMTGGQITYKLNYCNHCYDSINPEHKRMLVKSVSDLDIQGILADMGRGKDDVYMMDTNTDITKPSIILKFRRIHH